MKFGTLWQGFVRRCLSIGVVSSGLSSDEVVRSFSSRNRAERALARLKVGAARPHSRSTMG
jgi:hypothetical protein